MPGGALAASLVAWNYSSQPMWRDEWYTYSASVRTFPQLVGLVSNIDGGLSVFYLLMHTWMLLGDSVAWMRIPAAASTVVISVLVALIGRRVGGNVVGVMSGLLVTLLPAVVDHAQEARAYPLVLAAVAGTCLAMLRCLDRPTRGRAASLTVLALIASALHPIVGAPAVAGMFFGALVAPARAKRWWLVAAGLPAGVMAAVLLGVGFLQVDATGVSTFRGYRTLLRFSEVVSPSLGEVALMVPLVLVAVVSLSKYRRPDLLVLLGLTLVPILVIAASSAAGSFSLSRYVSASVVGTAVLVACGISIISAGAGSILPVHYRQLAHLAVTVCLVCFLAAPLAPSVVGAHTRAYRVDDPKSGAKALSEQWRRGDAVVFVGPVFRGLTNFYAPASFDPADPLLRSTPTTDDSFRGRESKTDEIADAVAGYQRVWLVGLLREGGTYESEKREEATVGRELVEREDFGEFSLELWR